VAYFKLFKPLPLCFSPLFNLISIHINSYDRLFLSCAMASQTIRDWHPLWKFGWMHYDKYPSPRQWVTWT
jgi:hypothetical protein